MTLLFLLTIIFIIIAVLFAISACVLSSRISKQEKIVNK